MPLKTPTTWAETAGVNSPAAVETKMGPSPISSDMVFKPKAIAALRAIHRDQGRP